MPERDAYLLVLDAAERMVQHALLHQLSALPPGSQNDGADGQVAAVEMEAGVAAMEQMAGGGIVKTMMNPTSASWKAYGSGRPSAGSA